MRDFREAQLRRDLLDSVQFLIKVPQQLVSCLGLLGQCAKRFRLGAINQDLVMRMCLGRDGLVVICGHALGDLAAYSRAEKGDPVFATELLQIGVAGIGKVLAARREIELPQGSQRRV